MWAINYAEATKSPMTAAALGSIEEVLRQLARAEQVLALAKLPDQGGLA